MREPREPRSIIDAAEKAAAAGDFASAEQLLREAALLQEERLGAVHPDLANTLNNLGIVCEITGNPTDAERYFSTSLYDCDDGPAGRPSIRGHEPEEPSGLLRGSREARRVAHSD